MSEPVEIEILSMLIAPISDPDLAFATEPSSAFLNPTNISVCVALNTASGLLLVPCSIYGAVSLAMPPSLLEPATGTTAEVVTFLPAKVTKACPSALQNPTGASTSVEALGPATASAGAAVVVVVVVSVSGSKPSKFLMS